MDDDTHLCAAVSAAVAATLAVEQPPWLRSFEQVTDQLTTKGESPSDAAWEDFRTGVRRCGEIVERFGCADPSLERVMTVAVFAAQGLAFARSVRESAGPARFRSKPSRSEPGMGGGRPRRQRASRTQRAPS